MYTSARGHVKVLNYPTAAHKFLALKFLPELSGQRTAVAMALELRGTT
jgi:hypothetical protein